MNTAELAREVKRLSEVKQKNEAQIPEHLLQTRYKKSYDNLCRKLEERRGELRANYKKYTRIIAEIADCSAAAEDMGLFMEDAGNELKEGMLNDPFAEALFDAVQKFIAEELKE